MISVGGSTDNKGNTYAVTKLMTTKFPLVAFVAKLAAQMENGRWDLELEWVPRDQNIEADALTNNDFSSFSPEHQIKVDPMKLGFLVLNDMLNLGDDFYEKKEAAKAAAKEATERLSSAKGPAPDVGAQAGRVGRRRKTFKETQPW